MDPVSVVGVAGSIVTIVGVISGSLQSLLDLQGRYKKANLSVSLLIGQLSTLKAALNQISAWINTSLVNVTQHEQLVLDLTTSLDGSELLILLLNERLNSLKRSSTTSLDTLGKGQLLWGEKDMQEYLNQLDNQISALNLLLTALQWLDSHPFPPTLTNAFLVDLCLSKGMCYKVKKTAICSRRI